MIRKQYSMKSALRAVAAVAVLGGSAGAAMACGMESYLGQVCMMLSNYCPRGTTPADGRQMNIQANAALYAVMGAVYGGDGKTYFNLPDFRGRSPVAQGLGPNLSNVALGTKSGAEVANVGVPLPAHTHGVVIKANSLTASASLPFNNIPVSGISLSGSVSVNALNGDNPPSGGQNIPKNASGTTAAVNTVGRSGSSTMFYPEGNTKVSVPVSHNLAVSGGTVSGSAAGNVALPSTDQTVTTTSAGIANPAVNVPTITPRLAVNFCVVTDGLFPSRE